jgi:hypothetical protein
VLGRLSCVNPAGAAALRLMPTGCFVCPGSWRSCSRVLSRERPLRERGAPPPRAGRGKGPAPTPPTRRSSVACGRGVWGTKHPLSGRFVPRARARALWWPSFLAKPGRGETARPLPSGAAVAARRVRLGAFLSTMCGSAGLVDRNRRSGCVLSMGPHRPGSRTEMHASRRCMRAHGRPPSAGVCANRP